MSRRNKLQKFSDLHSFPNVYENLDATNPGLFKEDGVPIELKGKWKELHFKNENPITLELACGKGDYSLGLAQLYPNRNFIGVDIKGARIWKGAGVALDLNLPNVAFLRTRIEQISLFFDKDEVDEIWITFPDPFLRSTKSNRRLTSPIFLEQFRKLLKKGGIVHLKTDERLLYDYTIKVLEKQKVYSILDCNDNIYSKAQPSPELEIKTFYEIQHLAAGKSIKYIRFQLQV